MVELVEGEANAGQAAPPSMPDAGEAMSIEEFCSRRAHLDDDWCEYRDRCCTPEDVASGGQDLAEEACLEELTKHSRTDSPTRRAMSDGERLRRRHMCHLDYCAPTLDLGQSCSNFTFCLS